LLCATSRRFSRQPRRRALPAQEGSDRPDVIAHDYLPGEDFNKALLKIWLGDKPVTEDLKKALLGDGT
jgi:hypothetical protein